MLASLTQQVASAVSVTLATGLLQLSLALRGGGGGLVALDFQWAFVGMGALALVALLAYAKLNRDAGAQVSGHGKTS